jgi:pyruvate dehydrogenase E2 component (dihydrolipoamide acetyltransferase)
MTEITMPRLSDSMEDGTILKWLKAEGETVNVGDDLIEIETDKATITYASEAGGTVQIIAAEGTTHPVGAVIATVGEPTPADARRNGSGGEPATVADQTQPPAQVPSGSATPLAKRAAQMHRVDLGGLRGSGPRGRITRADVLAAAGVPPPAPARPAPASVQHRDTARGEPETRTPSRVQQVIAQRMVAAHTTIPSFEVETEVAMDEAVALRARLKDIAGDQAVPSLNDLVIKACGLALRGHARVNASYVDGQFQLHPRINVGFAVATEDALIVPTLDDADAKSLAVIAAQTRRLTERARSGEITPAELAGATFTVSNLGMYGMTAIRPVINPPQVAILGIGATRQMLARAGAEIVDRTVATLTLSSDHRILYGADAARFLADVRALLEEPLRLML